MFNRTARRLLIACVGLALLLPCGLGPARAAEPEVSALRFGINPPLTRFVVDLDEKVAFEARSLAGPPRLVVDLPRVRWRVEAHPQGRPRGLIGAFRYGQLDPEHSRIVLDVKEPFRIVSQDVLPPGGGVEDWRLVIDIAPDDAAPPAPPQAARAVVPPPPPRPTPPRAVAQRSPAPVAAPLPAPEAARIPFPVPEAVEAPPPAPQPKPVMPAAGPRRPVIALDPGHGGIDPGAVGVGEVLEKTVTLAMAQAIERQLEASGRFKVVLTRNDDTFVRLRERIERARAAEADLFVSLHADSIGLPEHRGASVYTLSEEASDAEAARLAAKENKADIIVGADLSNEDAYVATILIDLVQRDTNNRSIDFAETLIRNLREVTPLIRRSRRYAGFAVLKAPDVPSVLLELGYLSNAKDARNLSDPAYRNRLAVVIAEAIERYFADFEAAL